MAQQKWSFPALLGSPYRLIPIAFGPEATPEPLSRIWVTVRCAAQVAKNFASCTRHFHVLDQQIHDSRLVG